MASSFTEQSADVPEESDIDSASEYESDSGHSTPLTAGATPRTPRPSELKVHHCPFEGCTKSFNRLSRLTEHQRSHTGQRIFKCKEQGCGKDFLRESHLKHHVKSAHTDVRNYVCHWDGCDKKFATGTRLRRHITSHEGKEKYRCRGYDGCNETFRKHATLTRHILAQHKGQKAFPCPDVNLETNEKCTMAFDTAEKLRSHQRAQHDPTRFSCTICLDAILTMNVQGDEELEIDTSQAYFPTYALLQAHTAEVHPPTCPHCLGTFSTQRELRRHIEGVHGLTVPNNDDKPKEYPCTYPNCTSSFTRKSNLNVHFNTVHKGQRSFVCGETDLTNSKNLPLFDGQDVTELESCGRSFTSKSSLEEHVRTAHMGLLTKQMERKLKRKAAAAAMDQDEDGAEVKNKRTKKGKKSKGKSVLSILTGVRGDTTTYQDLSMPEDYGFEESGDYFPIYSADNDHEEEEENDGAEIELFDPPTYSTGAELGPAIDPLLLLT